MDYLVLDIIKNHWEEFIPLISPLVVILLFGIERILSYYIRKKDIERTWYFKVLIDPNLYIINTFFSTSQSQFLDSCNIIENKRNENDNISEFEATISKEIGKFQELKRVFEINIISAINYKYPETSNKLYITLMELEDQLTQFYDNNKVEEFKQSDIEKFVRYISEIKSIWLSILYEPIQ